MSSENGNKKMLAYFAAFTVITGGSVGGFLWDFSSKTVETINQVQSNVTNIQENKHAISERLTLTSFKRYTLTNDLENAKAKLAQFEVMTNLTLNQKAEAKYLSDSINRWQTKLNELDDE
jgi:hypothetical protein